MSQVVCLHIIISFSKPRASGAGIGGLTLSAALGAMKRHNSVLEVDIYEGSPRISSLGAGIGFWTRTWKVMKKIGLDQDLLQFLPEAPNESSISETLKRTVSYIH